MRSMISILPLRCAALVTFFTVAAVSSAFSQSDIYPSRAIHLIIPFTPGGTTDVAARIIQQRMQKDLGQPIVIENRPGAAGNVGMDYVSHAAPDGYTILFADVGSITINAAVMPDMRVKPMQDFVPVSVITETPSLLLVAPNFPPKTVAELVQYVKERPGQLSFASQGVGSQNRFSMESFIQRAGLKLVHVPYSGGPGPAADVSGGHIPMMFGGLPPTIGLIRGGQLRVLAVATKERIPELPDTPTFIEAGYPDLVMGSWQAAFVPKGTPQLVIDKLYAALKAALSDPTIRKILQEGGLTAVGLTPEESLQYITKEERRWTEVARAVGASAK